MSEEVKKPLYKKWWFWLIVVVFVVGALGSSNDNKPVETASEPAQQQAQPAEPAIEVTISGADLAQAFEDNEVKAKKDYTGKWVEITGTVADIGEVFGQTYITLKAKGDFALTQTQCFFEDEEEINKVAELSKGDKVTIIGKIGEKSLNVSVNDCRIKQ